MWYITLFIVIFFTLIILLSTYSQKFKRFFDKDTEWPPVISQCPDYWVVDPSSKKCTRSPACKLSVKKGPLKCVNRGDARPECASFPVFRKSLRATQKKAIRKRATDCKVLWNGVSEIA